MPTTLASAQDIYNASWKKFIVEDGEPSVEDGNCVYLTEDGRKCSIGLCIPDGHYFQRERCFITGLRDRFPEDFAKLFAPDVCSMDRISLENFQRELHDELANKRSGGWLMPKQWRKERYITIAKLYKLEVPT